MSVCWPQTEFYETSTKFADYYNTSYYLYLSTSRTICIFGRKSNYSDYILVNVFNHNFPTYPSLALVNESVGFAVTEQCESIALNISNAKNSMKGSVVPRVSGNIVGSSLEHS